MRCSAASDGIRSSDSTRRSSGSTRSPNFRPHIHPEDVDHATRVDGEELDRLIREDRNYHIEFRIIRPDGEMRRVRSIASLVRDRTTRHLRAVGCITDVTDGAEQTVLPHPTPGNPFDAPDTGPADTLSARERECLIWVSIGKTAWETATILGRSQRTVEFHLENAVRKLRAANKVHAVAIAIREGLL